MFIQVGSTVKFCHVLDPGSRCFCAAACSSGGSFLVVTEFAQEHVSTKTFFFFFLIGEN